MVFVGGGLDGWGVGWVVGWMSGGVGGCSGWGGERRCVSGSFMIFLILIHVKTILYLIYKHHSTITTYIEIQDTKPI